MACCISSQQLLFSALCGHTVGSFRYLVMVRLTSSRRSFQMDTNNIALPATDPTLGPCSAEDSIFFWFGAYGVSLRPEPEPASTDHQRRKRENNGNSAQDHLGKEASRWASCHAFVKTWAGTVAGLANDAYSRSLLHFSQLLSFQISSRPVLINSETYTQTRQEPSSLSVLLSIAGFAQHRMQ